MRIFVIVLLALPILVLAFIGLRFLVRGTPVKRVRSHALHEAAPGVVDDEFVRAVELLARIPLERGNHARFLCSGDETYPQLYDDLRSAQRSITMQMYYCKPGQVADTVREILIDRARAGVQVLFLLDAFGAQSLSKEYREGLREAGVTVTVFRPVKWYALEKAYTRSHIRVVVIDGELAYTGGFGLDDKWLGDGRSTDHWRDTNVRFTGPAVPALQATFAAGWAEATGDLLTGEPFFPPLEGDVRVGQRHGDGALAGVLHAAPTVGSTSAERFMALAIGGARRSLFITNAYFVPDDGFTTLLCRAADRGVDVRILTAGDMTDVKSTLYAGRARYERLLRAGVRIWEYAPTTMHAKTLVADARFGSVGTMNFDNRSMAFNDETNFVFLDDALGRGLHEIFEEDLEHSREIRLVEFRKRPWTDRLKERFFDLMTPIL